MEILKAQAIISDHMLMNGIDEKFLKDRVNHDLTHNLAKAIMESENFRKIIVKREPGLSYVFSRSETRYEAEVVVLTRDEVREYKELLELKKLLKSAVR